MRPFLILATAIALASCRSSEVPTAGPSVSSPMAYGPGPGIERVPLPFIGSVPRQPGDQNETPSQLGWQASPRWSAIQGDGCIEVDADSQPSQFKRC